jgi:hypothetical protein
MPPSPGRRSDVAAVELNPRMRGLIHGVRRQADDEFGLIALFAEELEQDERADKTARLMIANPERAPNGVAQQFGGMARDVGASLRQVVCKMRKRRFFHAAPDRQI